MMPAHSSLVGPGFVLFFSFLAKANVEATIGELTRSKSSTQLSIVCPTLRISDDLKLDTIHSLSPVQVGKLIFEHTLVPPTSNVKPRCQFQKH